MDYAARMGRLGTETAFDVLVKAKALEAQGKKVVHLQIGEPDFDTPGNIIDAAIKALKDGYTHYGPSAGLLPLREVIAEHISKDRGIPAHPDNVVVTPGAKPIIFFSLLACVEEGDEVIYPNPGFPIYESVINFLGAKPVPLPLKEEREFRFDIGDLEALLTDKTKYIIINSPHNPTGGMLTAEDFKGVADLIRGKNIFVLADEVYSKIIYEGTHVSITGQPDMLEQVILLDGFSKTYAMTGWRLGYGVMPKKLAFHITRLMTNSNSCTASFSQVAGIEAITGPQDATKRMVAEFKARRDVIVDGLNKIEGITCLRPAGAFYVFPNVTALGMETPKLADHLLQEFGVAALAGNDFGKYGDGYLRFSYANSIENLKEGLTRIADCVRSLQTA